jgi:glycosyltransferase involved in cell wall biosynthesis
VKTTISVIVPVYNAVSTLERCLEALADQTHVPTEIIIADNGSTDASAAMVRRWMQESALPLRLVEVARRGAAAARNDAAREAAGEWLAFTDSDCVPDPDWLATGMELLAGSDKGIVALAGPAWGALEGDAAARMLGLTSLSVGLDEHIRSDAGPTGTQGFAAANLWVRRQTFIDVKGFDETLAVSGEDFDLCARIYATGARLLYSPRLRVRHIHASGIPGMWRKMVRYGRAHAMLLGRYGEPGIYLDLPLLGQWRIPCRCHFWCNLASAEKKMLLLILLAVWQPWLGFLVPVYLAWMGHALRRRAAGLGADCGVVDSLWLAVLLLVKSAAMSWGRMRGSFAGAIAC